MTKKEAHEALGLTMTIDAVIDKIFDDNESEVQGIVTVLKKLDEFPPIEKDKAINELIEILSTNDTESCTPWTQEQECGNCIHKPAQGESYDEICGMCSRFYSDNYEETK